MGEVVHHEEVCPEAWEVLVLEGEGLGCVFLAGLFLQATMNDSTGPFPKFVQKFVFLAKDFTPGHIRDLPLIFFLGGALALTIFLNSFLIFKSVVG